MNISNNFLNNLLRPPSDYSGQSSFGNNTKSSETQSPTGSSECSFSGTSDYKPFSFGNDSSNQKVSDTQAPQSSQKSSLESITELLSTLLDLIKSLMNNSQSQNANQGSGEGSGLSPAAQGAGGSSTPASGGSSTPAGGSTPAAGQSAPASYATEAPQGASQPPVGNTGNADGSTSGTTPDMGAQFSQKSVQQPAQTPETAPASTDTSKASAEKTSDVSSVGNSQGSVDPNKKALNLVNDTNEPITVKFTPNDGKEAIPDVTLQPGQKLSQEMPEGWAGNIRKTTNNNDIATLGEFKFADSNVKDNTDGANQSYYDVSLIEGYNGNMTITPADGGKTSGSSKDLLAGAPDAAKAKDDQGNVIGLKKTTVAEQFNNDVIDYLRQNVAEDESYVKPKDDLSTLGTNQNQFTVTFH